MKYTVISELYKKCNLFKNYIDAKNRIILLKNYTKNVFWSKEIGILIKNERSQTRPSI
jgi:hypothetical protein